MLVHTVQHSAKLQMLNGLPRSRSRETRHECSVYGQLHIVSCQPSRLHMLFWSENDVKWC